MYLLRGKQGVKTGCGFRRRREWVRRGREDGPDLFEVGTDEVDEILGDVGSDGFLAGGGAFGEMKADVVFEDFGHEAVDAAADGGELHEDLGTFVLGFEGPLDGGHLAADTLDAVEELETFAFHG